MSFEFFPFSNDRMFCTVLARDKNLAKAFLETVLEKQIERLECINAQKILNYSVDVRYVRFDVFFKDGSGVIYDVEMETSHHRTRLNYLPLRSRLYGSAIDSEEYPPGTKCKDIKNTYVIFICLTDPFEFGLAKYSGTLSCSENPDTKLQNGITYLYLNCNPVVFNVSNELKGLLSYIRDRSVCGTELTRRIDEAVKKYNFDKEWRKWFVTFEQQLEEERYFSKLEGFEEGIEKGIETGIEKGIVKGIEKGIEQNKAQMIASMIEFGLDDSAISAIVKTMTADEIAAIRKTLPA